MGDHAMTLRRQASIAVLFFTYFSARHLRYCLPPVISSPLRPRVLVVDSSSEDGTVEEAARLGAETLVIPKADFNHGTTREMARKHIGAEIVVMMTPDAYPRDEYMLGTLVAPILDGRASLAYGRQIPRPNAPLLEALPRLFNYGAESRIYTFEDIPASGVKTFFCGDAWTAYRNSDLDAIGGFDTVLRAEEHIAAAKLLLTGHRIAYVAEAIVVHSHTASLLTEFRHYFEVGYVTREYQTLLAPFGDMKGHGVNFAAFLVKTLVRRAPYLLPYGLFHCLVKWLGYEVGRRSLGAPTPLKEALSLSKFYWTSKAYLQKPKSR
jgi:rhamnosyltransferase